MSRMVDGLREKNCRYFADDADGKRTQQLLRLAALLHDIGHYPLAHLGEQAFLWFDAERRNSPQRGKSEPKEANLSLLAQAATRHKGQVATHERLGELILTHPESEIHKILRENAYDPAEIARIINGEHARNPFYSQLMSSTLDCDRLDFLARDALASGTKYGLADVQYIIQNIAWDAKEELVCYEPKAINAIEHFIMARYFSYNITYHKTVMGFELMAKALFYSMMQDSDLKDRKWGGIVRCMEDVEKKIADDNTFLANFNDEYFWHYLELWDPNKTICKKLKKALLNRTPLRTVWEEKSLISSKTKVKSRKYAYVEKNLLSDIWSYEGPALAECKITEDLVLVYSRQIAIEKMSYSDLINKKETIEEERLALVKIKEKSSGARNLICFDSSVIQVLSEYKSSIARVYALVEKGSRAEKKLEEVVRGLVEEGARDKALS